MAHLQTASKTKFGVALLRVSTDKQFQDGDSIQGQRRKVEFVARRERIDIVRFFTEHYSGRKADRQVLDDLFAFLAENRDITCVIVGDIDRFTRGGTEIYLALKRQLRELNVALIDTTGIIQPERKRLEHLGVEYNWSIESPSHYAEIFMAEKARAEASDILTRTIGQQIQLTREGYQCRAPNFGYVLGGRGHRADLPPLGTQVDCGNGGISGDHAGQSRNSGIEPSDDARSARHELKHKPFYGFVMALFVAFTFSGSAIANEPTMDPAVGEIMAAYRVCVSAASAKASDMKTAKLRGKVFHGQLKGCDRSLAAELGILRETRQQEVLDQAIADITDSLVLLIW